MGRFLFIAIASLVLTSCGVSKDATNKTGEITIKLVQINDIYEIAPLNGGEYGGLARVGFIRDSIKEKFPNTYLFLAGDFLNPSLLGTVKVDGERLNGKHMIDVLNALEIDLVTFGNHEFDLKEKELLKRLEESTFKWTTANTRHVTENGTLPFVTGSGLNKIAASDYEIFTAIGSGSDKLKFGVFGVTLPSNPKDYVYYGDIYENAERAYNLALQNTDFVVGLTHVALEEDFEIAKRLQSIPLIMGGHEHFNMLEKEGGTIIAKADANAKSVYVHTLTYNLNSKNLQVDSDLVMVTDKKPSSPQVEVVVTKWNELLNNKLKEVIDNPNEIIYHASIPLDGTDKASRSKQTNLGDIITRSMANAYTGKVNAALVNGGSIRIDDNLIGDITSTDVFRVLPFGGSVLRVDLKGNLLIEILNYGVEKSGTGAYLQRYNFSKNTNGNWQIGTELIENENTYSVAFSDFLLKGYDIPFLTPENPEVLNVYYPIEKETASDIRKAIIEYFKLQ